MASRLSRPLALLATLAATCTLAVPPASADRGPSAKQVAAGKARVADLERKVSAAADAIAATQAALERADTAAEVAIEGYNRARVRQDAAAREVTSSQLVLAAATSQVAVARRQVGRFAAAAYEGGGLTDVSALLTSTGPDAMLYRLGALDAVARSKRDVLEQMTAASVYQRTLQQQAAAVLARARAAAADAARARARAQHQVEHAAAMLVTLRHDRQQLATLLAQARRHVSGLERARLEALAQAKAQAEARAAEARAAAARARAEKAAQHHPRPSGGGSSGGGSSSGSSGGSSGDYSGTVSADTERRALDYAESQIGKPYEWGASGPDSYDCSGLVMWAYGRAGVSVDHYTGDQWNEGAHIPLSALRAGDLIFFATNTSDPNTIHHVGIYIGNGEMVEAPYTGANVRISNAFRPDLIGAVRLFNR